MSETISSHQGESSDNNAWFSLMEQKVEDNSALSDEHKENLRALLAQKQLENQPAAEETVGSFEDAKHYLEWAKQNGEEIPQELEDKLLNIEDWLTHKRINEARAGLLASEVINDYRQSNTTPDAPVATDGSEPSPSGSSTSFFDLMPDSGRDTATGDTDTATDDTDKTADKTTGIDYGNISTGDKELDEDLERIKKEQEELVEELTGVQTEIQALQRAAEENERQLREAEAELSGLLLEQIKSEPEAIGGQEAIDIFTSTKPYSIADYEKFYNESWLGYNASQRQQFIEMASNIYDYVDDWGGNSWNFINRYLPLVEQFNAAA